MVAAHHSAICQMDTVFFGFNFYETRHLANKSLPRLYHLASSNPTPRRTGVVRLINTFFIKLGIRWGISVL